LQELEVGALDRLDVAHRVAMCITGGAKSTLPRLLWKLTWIPPFVSTPQSCSRKSMWKYVRRNSPSVIPESGVLLEAHDAADRLVLDVRKHRASMSPRWSARAPRAAPAGEGSCRRDRRGRAGWCGRSSGFSSMDCCAQLYVAVQGGVFANVALSVLMSLEFVVGSA
jgi:hypothetical protein